jgi:hypothetical protein
LLLLLWLLLLLLLWLLLSFSLLLLTLRLYISLERSLGLADRLLKVVWWHHPGGQLTNTTADRHAVLRIATHFNTFAVFTC